MKAFAPKLFLIIFLIGLNFCDGYSQNEILENTNSEIVLDTIIRFNSETNHQENFIYKIDSSKTMMGFDTITTFNPATYEETFHVDTINVVHKELIFQSSFPVEYTERIDTTIVFYYDTYEEKVTIKKVKVPKFKKI